MIRNKKDIYKKLNALSENHIKKGIELKHLIYSLKKRDNKTFKELKEFVKEILKDE